MNPSLNNNDAVIDHNKIPLVTKLIYGSGDWGRASYNTLRQIFYAIFLTDVVGLDPRLASIAALVGIIWDAINDPIVGTLSDNVRTRWGRRRPFMLLFSIPFALAFLVLWWAPPWKTQAMLTLHITLAFMFSDTIQTLVTVPYLALTPEIAKEYDERTSLTSIRMFFNLIASLVTAVAAPTIMESIVKNGFSQQQGYLTVAAVFGGLAIIPFILIFIFVKERELLNGPSQENITLRTTLKLLWKNTPFKYATGIYVLNWIAFDIVALMLPFFLLYWVAKGNLLEKVIIFGAKMSIESVVLGIMLITATVTIPFWNFIAQKYSKRVAYIAGMLFWLGVQISIFSIQQGQTGLIIFLAFLAGIGVSSAHIMPDALFPDVIDWDEYRTNTRREGMYYGAINFLRKISSAFAVFLSLQILGWFGYRKPPLNVLIFTQSEQTLQVIRLMTGPFVAVLLIGAVIVTLFYPLSRERQNFILRAIERRKNKRAE
jgi:GPH family glycoside/pentoside/hexuronide:cation symporter